MGLFGTALLYGDGAITPAISVLSAVEGLELITPVFGPYVIPIAVLILVVLFAVQARGTAAVGAVFGPVMVVWFLTLAVLGIVQVIADPGVLVSLNPVHAVSFFVSNTTQGFLALGSVFLVVTGGEALYADMGHFGAKPIRVAWFGLVLPSLMLNYLGQGAMLISRPETADNPFFRMVPAWGLIPLVILATAAAVIASQALISGAYSLTTQAIQLQYSPRMRIDHTSAHEHGQVYVPFINWTLMLACIGLVVGFGSSSALAGAYGIAVTTTMVVTTILFYAVAVRRWRWPMARAVAVCGLFLVVDLAFLGANLVKIPRGGWFPLLLGLVIFVFMTTWRKGRRLVYASTRRGELPIDQFLDGLRADPPLRVEGTAVYMFPEPDRVPPSLLANLRHQRVLHETVVLLAVTTVEGPTVPAAARVEVERLGDGFFVIELEYGFAETPNVPRDLETLLDQPDINREDTTYFLGRETIRSTAADSGMVRWRERLFALLHRNAVSAAEYFRLPPDRVIEIGIPVEL